MRSLWTASAVVALGLLLCVSRARAAQTAPVQPLLTTTSVDVAAGEALFVGRTPLANGGPACIACHSTVGLRFPYGGTLGPDLTHAYSTLGPEGLTYAMQTLYFPTMIALFRTRPLTPDEQAKLGAFLRRANDAPPSPRPATLEFGLVGLAGVAALLALTAVAGRRRLRSVRRRLLARTRPSGGRA